MNDGPRDSSPSPTELSLAKVRERAHQALERARFKIYPVPIAGKPGYFTLATEAEAVRETGFDEEHARRYASAINNEAELARAMIMVLAEYERLAAELAAQRTTRPEAKSTPDE